MGHLSEAILGVSTKRERLDRTIQLATTPNVVAPANPNRVRLDLINPTAIDVWVLDDADVATSQGFILPNSNGVLSFQRRVDGDLVGAEFSAIAESGTPTIFRRGEVSAEPLTGGE